MEDTEFSSWLSSAIAATGADAEVFTEYLVGIMTDDDGTTVEERSEEAVAMLEASVDDEASLDALRSELVARWKAHKQLEEAASASAKALSVEEKRKAAEKARAQLRAEAEQEKAQQELRRPALSREEEARRRAYLSKYGMEMQFDDEDGNPVKEAEDDDKDLVKNDNAARVRAKHQAQKEAHKRAHDDRMAKIKQQQEAERKKKEKVKQRVAKKERRRGR